MMISLMLLLSAENIEYVTIYQLWKRNKITADIAPLYSAVYTTLSPLPRTAVLPARPRQMAHTMLDLPVPLAPTIMFRLGPGYTSV